MPNATMYSRVHEVTLRSELCVNTELIHNLSLLRTAAVIDIESKFQNIKNLACLQAPLHSVWVNS